MSCNLVCHQIAIASSQQVLGLGARNRLSRRALHFVIVPLQAALVLLFSFMFEAHIVDM